MSVLSMTLLAIALMISATRVNAVITVIILTIIAIACAAFCVFAAIQRVTDQQKERVLRQLNEITVGLKSNYSFDAERYRVIRERDRVRAEQERAMIRAMIEQERLEEGIRAQQEQARARAREANLIRRPVVIPNEHTELLSAHQFAGMSWADMVDDRDNQVNNINLVG
jgi:cell division protein FtsX